MNIIICRKTAVWFVGNYVSVSGKLTILKILTQQIFFDQIWIDALSETNDLLGKVVLPVLMWAKTREKKWQKKCLGQIALKKSKHGCHFWALNSTWLPHPID